MWGEFSTHAAERLPLETTVCRNVPQKTEWGTGRAKTDRGRSAVTTTRRTDARSGMNGHGTPRPGVAVAGSTRTDGREVGRRNGRVATGAADFSAGLEGVMQ